MIHVIESPMKTSTSTLNYHAHEILVKEAIVNSWTCSINTCISPGSWFTILNSHDIVHSVNQNSSDANKTCLHAIYVQS